MPQSNDPKTTARHLLENGVSAILIKVVGASGSTPRETGAMMVVAEDETHGTIGGGQLEYLAIAKARELLTDNIAQFSQKIPLGPGIGQCCGGNVDLDYRLLSKKSFRENFQREEALPHVYVFGVGHTGSALAKILQGMPVKLVCIDSRKDMLLPVAEFCETLCTPLPEQIVKSAPAKSVFVVLTHEHSQDFLIAAEALNRKDAAYTGMIGSGTKRAVFKNWLAENGFDANLEKKLTCPIGGKAIKDKRPAIIALQTAVEIMQSVLGGSKS